MYSSSSISVEPEFCLTLDLPCPIGDLQLSSSSIEVFESLLEERHLDEFRGSGISDELIAACGVRTVDGYTVCTMLNWTADPATVGSGWAIPFGDPADPKCLWRIKLDQPRVNPDGDPIKYESPKGSTNRAFRPPGFDDAEGQRIVITEGEKKSLSAINCGINCLGLTGVWNWHRKRLKDDTGRSYGSRQLIPDLAAIPWANRDVVICFDSDAANKSSVQLAEQRLAESLAKRGAIVRVARLPCAPDGGKLGLDDALVQLGADAVQKILDEAQPPELPQTSWPEVARLLLEIEFGHDSGHNTLINWRGTFWRWSGRHYEEIERRVIDNVAYRLFEKIACAPTRGKANELVAALTAETEIADVLEPPCCLEPCLYRDDDTPLAFSNGVHFANFDTIEDWEFLGSDAPSPVWFCTGSRNFAYNEIATCPTWELFLASSLPDPDARRLLQQWFGYCLSGRVHLHRLLVLLGAHRAGKSIIADTLSEICGKAATVTSSLKSLGEEFGLWPLIGKQLLLIPDASDRGSCIAAVERLKAISGCDALGVNRKYLAPLNVKLKTRITLVANQLPRFLDPSGALHRRLLIVHFGESFAGREDRTLPGRIRAELPGIFNWSLRGWIDLRTVGEFVVPASSQDVLEEAAHVFSPIAAFLDEFCDLGPDCTVPSDQLWWAWQNYCEANGQQTGNRSKLGTDLRSCIPALSRVQVRFGDVRIRTYQGLQLNRDGKALLKPQQRCLFGA